MKASTRVAVGVTYWCPVLFKLIPKWRGIRQKRTHLLPDPGFNWCGDLLVIATFSATLIVAVMVYAEDTIAPTFALHAIERRHRVTAVPTTGKAMRQEEIVGNILTAGSRLEPPCSQAFIGAHRLLFRDKRLSHIWQDMMLTDIGLAHHMLLAPATPSQGMHSLSRFGRPAIGSVFSPVDGVPQDILNSTGIPCQAIEWG